jgi:hypothetical protein
MLLAQPHDHAIACVEFHWSARQPVGKHRIAGSFRSIASALHHPFYNLVVQIGAFGAPNLNAFRDQALHHGFDFG